MALVDSGEPDYESDPEEIKRSLATRRREASDDDDDDDDGEEVKYQRSEIDSEQSDEEVGTVKYGNDDNKSEDGEGSYAVDDDQRSLMMKAAEDVADHIDGEEDEKEKQSSTVPTGGAFYMHDDRFQEVSAGRRRTRGGRNSWGSGDERKWGHDKFEEMNTLEKPNDRNSRSRVRGRGRGRGRGQDRGYTRGSSSTTSSSKGQQIFVPKSATRGGGPSKHEIPLSKGNQAQPTQSKQLRNYHASRNSHEKISHLNSRSSQTASSKTGNEGAHTQKNVVASSLSSASPPFYPSVSSSNLVHDMERLHTNESSAPSGKKYMNTKSVYSPVYPAQTFQSTIQGRDAPAAGNAFYPQSHSQGARFSSPMQLKGDLNGTAQSGIRPSGQGFDQYGVKTSLSSSTQKTSSARNRNPPGGIESASETGASTGKGKGSLPPSGSGSLMYNSYMPVLQFAGQHGGVPNFEMAFQGYIQPENGVGNSKMAWVPVLTRPGGLGASYSPPYAAINGSYQAHQPGLPSSAVSSSKENSTNNFNDQEKPIERPESTESGVSKRQNNSSKQPRRYSEMSFSK